MKSYRPPKMGFKFPFRRRQRRSLASGHLNAPKQGRPSKSMPSIKQFTQMKAGRPKPRVK